MTLHEFARSLKTLSPLMEGREKMDTKDVKNETLSIIDFDIVNRDNGDEDAYAIVIFAEYPDGFLFGGKVLTGILIDIEKEYPNCHETLEEEPLQIKLFTQKPKKGKYAYTDVEVL